MSVQTICGEVNALKTYFTDPRREREAVVTSEGEEVTGYCGDVADIREKHNDDDQHELHRHPFDRHALLQDVNERVCADVLQRKAHVRHRKA